MKKTIALFSFLFAATCSVFAQNSELAHAFTYFSLRQTDKAKEAIDKATLNEKTKDSPKTWAYRSLIYSALALDSTKAATQEANLKIAAEAIEKTKVLDTKGEYKTDITNSSRNMAQVYANKGVKQFNAKDFKGATESFKYVVTVIPTDTSMLGNVAVAATNDKNYAEAVNAYTQLLKVNPSSRTYDFLAQAQRENKDDAGFLNTIAEGLKKYPNDNTLATDEINYYINKGQATKIIGKLQTAINKDPKNSSLYVVLGTAYENLHKTDSAEAIYKKAIVLDPANFVTNFNLGAIYYTKAATILNTANKKLLNKPKEYAVEVTKFQKLFEQAIPFMEAAYKANPEDTTTLTTLRELYVRTNKNAKAAALQKILDDRAKK